MALVNLGTERTYDSITGGERYRFTVGIDQNGVCQVREIRTPTGLLQDSVTGIPGPVLDDINTAKQQLEDLVASTSDINGTVTFTAENSKAVAFATALSGTTYGVSLTLPDFISWRIVSKTTTGFTIELGANFTGDVRFDVFI